MDIPVDVSSKYSSFFLLYFVFIVLMQDLPGFAGFGMVILFSNTALYI